MAFHDVRFPDNISRGARGRPERRTQVVELASGDEEHNAGWANSRRRYDVAYGIRRADDLAAVVAFFEARNGRLHGFPHKDWADYKSGLPSQAVTATDQPIGTGNGAITSFTLLKRYTSGAQSWTRAIPKPVAGSVRLALNGVEQMLGWSVDTTTGSVSFATARGAGVAITAGFEFDVPVRSDSDTLDVTSMGHLTLNMLLSFAQFEREVTAERIQDKITASKRGDLWMGGLVPLGPKDPDAMQIARPSSLSGKSQRYRQFVCHRYRKARQLPKIQIGWSLAGSYDPPLSIGGSRL
jgi:uncharacterized protein (TIGR02217 family)